MADAVYNLDRETKIANNIDPRGKKWEIKHIKGSALYVATPNPNSGETIPDEFEGRWTKPVLLQKQIALYLNRAWDKSDEIAMKNERKTQAAKEAKYKEPTE